MSFDLAHAEILSLIGRSGSGKSTLLNLIAGFDTPATGAISLEDKTLAGEGQFIRPEKRKIGLVSQTGDLFPHFTVSKNHAHPIASQEGFVKTTFMKLIQ